MATFLCRQLVHMSMFPMMSIYVVTQMTNSVGTRETWPKDPQLNHIRSVRFIQESGTKTTKMCKTQSNSDPTTPRLHQTICYFVLIDGVGFAAFDFSTWLPTVRKVAFTSDERIRAYANGDDRLRSALLTSVSVGVYLSISKEVHCSLRTRIDETLI